MAVNMEEMKKELDQSRQTIEKLQQAIESKMNISEKTFAEDKPRGLDTNGDDVPMRRTNGDQKDKRSSDSQNDDQGQVSSGRRPTSISLERRLQLLQQPPKTLRDVLENYLVMELALSNWVKKRPVLIGDTRTLERVL